MKVIHDLSHSNSLDFYGEQRWCIPNDWLNGLHITEDDSSQKVKEITMHTHGHTTVWGTHLGIARVRHSKIWFQQLRDWWMAHKGARRAANLATVSACWDATREVIAPFRAEAAPEMAAEQHTLSVATMLYGLS